jgi:3-methyladenine DNA glycosylase Tag
MGDMTDWIIENGMMFDEEYEREFDDDFSIGKICKYCGKSGLQWKQINNKWRLYDLDNNLHCCLLKEK